MCECAGHLSLDVDKHASELLELDDDVPSSPLLVHADGPRICGQHLVYMRLTQLSLVDQPVRICIQVYRRVLARKTTVPNWAGALREEELCSGKD